LRVCDAIEEGLAIQLCAEGLAVAHSLHQVPELCLIQRAYGYRALSQRLKNLKSWQQLLL